MFADKISVLPLFSGVSERSDLCYNLLSKDKSEAVGLEDRGLPLISKHKITLIRGKYRRNIYETIKFPLFLPKQMELMKS